MTEEDTTADETNAADRIVQLERTVETLADRVVELETDRRREVREGTDGTRPGSISRRAAMGILGSAGLLGIGATTASADSQGQVGTAADPLRELYTEVVRSPSALKITTGGDATDAGNIVAGHRANGIANGISGATIAGGGYDDGTDAYPNEVSDNYGTISGGAGNSASNGGATIGGGEQNLASGFLGTVGGGNRNEASGSRATVAGGRENVATDEYASVGGGDRNEAGGASATVAGGNANTASSDSATVSGGDDNSAIGIGATAGGGSSNEASGDHSVVGGGSNNEAAGTNATVAGGGTNSASGNQATVLGGSGNLASGSGAVAAGFNATASGDAAVAIGDRGPTASGMNSVAIGNGAQATAGNGIALGSGAKAESTGTAVAIGNAATASEFAAMALGTNAIADAKYSFVWADGSDPNFSATSGSTGPTGDHTVQMLARDGYRFATSTDDSGDPTNGAYLTYATNGWASFSTRTVKQDLSTIDPETALDGVEALDVYEWRYQSAPETDHVGPMAEDFSDTFGLGDSDEHIDSGDASGVALAAIKGLAERLDEREARIEEQRDRIDDLEAENENLHERLDALEALVADGREPRTASRPANGARTESPGGEER